MNNTYLSNEDYDFIYSKVPRICVDLLIKNKENQVLLTKRRIEPYIGHWHLPGGRIKFRESINDAIIRIAKSELGISITDVGKIIGVCEFTEEYQKNQPRHSISMVHEIILYNYDELSSQDEYEWFSSLPEPIIPSHKNFLILNNIL